jgi:membrane protease YdiL (CAAX protease family)
VFGRPPGVVGWVALVLVVCVGAPVVEELFFRGLLQTRLVGRLGVVWGIVVTSVLFGAAHLIGWVGPITFVYATSIAAAGLVLGTLRHLTGRLGTSIAAHCIFNAQALILLALLR